MEYREGSKITRTFSAVIDILFISSLFYFFSESYRNNTFSISIVISFFIIYLFYCIFTQVTYGRTLGQLIMNLKIIDTDTTAIPNFKKVLIKELLSLTTLTGIGYLVFWHAHGVWWDKRSGTTVVRRVK